MRETTIVMFVTFKDVNVRVEFLIVLCSGTYPFTFFFLSTIYQAQVSNNL